MSLSVVRICVLNITLFFASAVAAEPGTLSDNQRIFSTQLGYELQYRVYTPAAASEGDKLPSLYVTDGQAYLAQGGFKAVLDQTIGAGEVKPVVVVFLDSRNPDNLEEDRRHTQFMCNVEFARFFAAELIPAINKTQPVSTSRDDRVSLGVSFGGLNSACFGLMLPKFFSGIAMHSPAGAKHVEVVRDLYENKQALPLKMFLSVGTRNDNVHVVQAFRDTLESKGYDLTFVKMRGQHNWDNWDRLLDDVLLTFFPAKAAD